MGWLGQASSTPTGDYQVETPESARADDVALISGQTNGVKSANLFPGFTDSGLTISTSGSTKVANRTAGGAGALLQSTYACLDSEITTQGYQSILFLRVKDGSGLYLHFGGAHALVGWVNANLDVTASSPMPNANMLYRGLGARIQYADVGATVGTVTDTWTLGAVGFDVYVKFNGVEVLRYKEYRCCNVGTAAVWSSDNPVGTTDVTIRYFPATMIGSNRPKLQFDIRDFGAKSTAVTTTGSMSAESPTLTVASSAGFDIGDQIIVEIGGEAGTGARGTEGVGGAWPALSYADAAAMNADSSKPTGTYAWLRSTGAAYAYNGSAWDQSYDNFDYYRLKALPYSLVAVITNIVGNVLTLDQNAVVATNNATVYVDAVPAFYPLTDDGYDQVMPEYIKILIPAGEYALSELLISAVKPHIQVIGAGPALTTLFSPKGTVCVGMYLNQCPNAVIRDLHFRGNHLMVHGEVDSTQRGKQGVETGSGWPKAISLYASSNSVIRDVTGENLLAGLLYVSLCHDTWGYNCTLTQDYGAQAYTGWYMQHVNCFGGGLTDCTVNGAKLIKAFESFSGYPSETTGLGQIYTRCGGQNALFSPNSSKGMQLLEWSSTVTTDAYGVLIAGYYGEAILNLSANAYHVPTDIYVRNPRIIQEGYARSSDSTSMYAIQVSPDCVGVVIEGEYEGETTPFSDALGGYISAPDYVSAADNAYRSYGSVAVIDQGSNTIIRGLRAVGSPDTGGYKSIDNTVALVAGTVQNNIADTFGFKTGTTKSGNRTNAGVSVP